MKYRLTAVGLVLALATGAGADLITDIDGCKLWLDSMDEATITTVEDGDDLRVVEWKDKSGFNHHFSQSNLPEAPLRDEDPDNGGGRASVFFTGSEHLRCDNPVTPDAVNGGTWFYVSSMYSWGGDQTIISKGPGSNFQIVQRPGDQSVNENNYGFYSKGILAESNSWKVTMYLYNGIGTTALEILFDGAAPNNWTSFYQNGGSIGSSSTIAPPLVRDDRPMALGAELTVSDVQHYFSGHILEVVFYDRVLTSDERNLVGRYLSTKHNEASAYTEVEPPAAQVRQTYLAPDSFEDYVAADGTDPNLVYLSTYWSSNGALDLETTEVISGTYALKAVVPASGLITKELPRGPIDYSEQEGRILQVPLKGQAGNGAGNVTVRILDDLDQILASETLSGATTLTNWTPLNIPVGAWASAEKLEIQVSAAATMYFDDLTFVLPEEAAQQVLSWPFNESSGTTVADASGNGIDGSLLGDFTDDNWIVNGGHSGLDNALELGVPSDPNIGGYLVQADNVSVPQGVGDIFAGHSSWTMNIWLYLNEANPATIAGFGNGSTDGTRRWLMDWGNGNIAFHAYTVGNFDTGEPYSVGEWQMVTVSYDKWSKVIRFYKNAELIYSNALDLVDTDPVVRIGVLDNVNYPSFDGMVDDFSIWSGVLPASDGDDDPTNDILSIWGSYTCDEGNSPLTDLNNDCRVDLSDIAIFMGQWLECTREPAADFCN